MVLLRSQVLFKYVREYLNFKSKILKNFYYFLIVYGSRFFFKINFMIVFSIGEL